MVDRVRGGMKRDRDNCENKEYTISKLNISYILKLNSHSFAQYCRKDFVCSAVLSLFRALRFFVTVSQIDKIHRPEAKCM